MATAVTLTLQRNLQQMFGTMWSLYNEAADIEKCYWATDASTWVGGKGSSDPVTVNTKLTKDQFLSGITLAGEIRDFFGNAAVTTADNLATVQTIRFGNTAGATSVPPSVESIGTRLYNMCDTCLTLFNQAKLNQSLYNESSIGTAFSGLASEIIVFGADMTKAEMVSAITLLQQWEKMFTNQAVTTGLYSATLSEWFRIT